MVAGNGELNGSSYNFFVVVKYGYHGISTALLYENVFNKLECEGIVILIIYIYTYKAVINGPCY
jgi:hypothetical protein